MSLFCCKACAAKDAHLADLRAQLASQNAFIKSQFAPTPQLLSAPQEQAQDANRALDGAGQSEEQVKHLSAVEQEAIALLTGRY